MGDSYALRRARSSSIVSNLTGPKLSRSLSSTDLYNYHKRRESQQLDSFLRRYETGRQNRVNDGIHNWFDPFYYTPTYCRNVYSYRSLNSYFTPTHYSRPIYFWRWNKDKYATEFNSFYRRYVTHYYGAPYLRPMYRGTFRTHCFISEVFSNKRLAIDTLILAYLWTCDTLVYYGLSLFSTQLAGNNYVNYMLSGLVELPSYIIAPFLLDWWGRRGAVSSMHFLAGAMLVLASFIASASTFRLILWMIAKFAIACVFTSIFAYGSEVFPTTARSFCMGMCAVTARFMGTFAPFTRSLEVVWTSFPLFLFGVLALLASGLTLILPETKHRNLPATASNV
uniref:Major facilitator superfamily (MFS) profile domain-containing protein n=1 Tax=Acrobeloides nanus TaxID=290746 RepID=A0A914CCP0_9BILA